MVVYLNELSSDVRKNLSTYLRLKKIENGIEANEYLFQVAIVDPFKFEAHLAGSVDLKVNYEGNNIKWDTFYPNAYVFSSRRNLSLSLGEGIGAYVHVLTLLAVSKNLENIESYSVCSNKNASVERLGQMRRLGLKTVMPYGENLGVMLDYMREKRGVDIEGVRVRENVYNFLLK